jgi:predicted transglutaminase-like cysteine proteinase
MSPSNLKPHTFILLALVITLLPSNCHSRTLFDYIEMPQANLNAVPQWQKVRARHPQEDVPSGSAALKEWYATLGKTKNLAPNKQLTIINDFANAHPYILDMQNYGVEDYWALVKEFLQNSGDCEDYAIIKFYSLRKLGFDNDHLRIVILQDTNLKVAHAVLAVYKANDIIILDNQVDQILSHNDIKHYTPIYSINEKGWWLHLPPM